MNINEIRSRAASYGIKTAKMSKADLIRAIQAREGNFDCFATAYDSVCDQVNCCWREDCFQASKKALAS